VTELGTNVSCKESTVSPVQTDLLTTILSFITGSPNGPVLFYSLASVVFRHCLSLCVTLPPGRTDRRPRARGRSAAAGPCVWTVGQPTLHGGPVRLRPFRATACWIWSLVCFEAVVHCVMFLKKTALQLCYLSVCHQFKNTTMKKDSD